MIGPFQESDGSISMRRILSALCFCASVALAVLAFPHSTAGWFVFLPAVSFLAAAILLLLFTTWEAVSSLIKAAKG